MKRKLKKFGLDDKEIDIYISCLRGSRTPTQITQETGIKRATVYYAIEKLKKIGLLAPKVVGKKKHVISVPPETALSILIENDRETLAYKESTFQELVSELTAFVQKESSDTHGMLYEGKEGIQTIVQAILREREDIYWIGSLDIVLETIGEEQFYRIMSIPRMDQETTSFAITHSDFLQQKRFSDLQGKFRQIKILDEVNSVPALLIAFGNHVVLASKSEKTLKVVDIVDPVMVRMFKLLYLSLWNRL